MFSFSINMAFEAFRRTKKFISNLFFMKRTKYVYIREKFGNLLYI